MPKPLIHQISLKVLMQNRRGEILLLRSFDQRAFRYDFPGGRINADEIDLSLEKILHREIVEELGKKVRYTINLNPVAFGRKKWYPGERERAKWRTKRKSIEIMYVVCRAIYLGGEIELSEEHTDYRWEKLSAKNVKKYFYPALYETMTNYFKYSK